ncbi:MAG: alpha/beta fold hydrolase [Bacteroidetes bacterium]|nr:alpha/beta fold hydrolase [Bacteroidota bacterium]MBU1577889.1 alpha/beta fold hydrolase [Bacteroidota bacterium]MBU2466705.1 alpha/beta fold hydrolase [Bacteroidota bacterium]MBU2558477.1 alpha/beta fold hydrolase [Bacteroidota bacterium]
MKTAKVSFLNHQGTKLMANIELPDDRKPGSFALFAHCFTCNKNFTAMRNISKALTAAGFGVLRFDFTGLGQSEGDFADTNFSGNIQDLKSAAAFMEKEYSAPALLVGHSLGGAAVLYAAAELKSVGAVATIAAPADPKHVKQLITSDLKEIEKQGYANVSIGGRPFTIKKQFIDDLEAVELNKILQNLGKALLIAHAPQDAIVGIDNAGIIFKNARHPKSFISLDGADHLLANEADSRYIGTVIAHWAKRYIDFAQVENPDTDLQLVASLNKSDKFTTLIKAGKHQLVGDEPEKYGGNDFGPSPYDFVSAGLASCTAMTIKMYADRKKWELEEVVVHIKHQKTHAEDCKTCENSTESKIDQFNRFIELKGSLEEEQVRKLMEIADKCPVHKTLRSEIDIQTTLKDSEPND